MNPDFTVIIPTLNEEINIEKTLQYIRSQKTRSSYEIIVVDGGSTDRTIEIAQKYVKVLNAPKKGKALQLNYAAFNSSSKYLIFLDADTHIPENYIERVKNEFEKDQDLWACGAGLLYTGERSGIWHTFVVLQAIIDFVQFAFFASIWLLLKLLPYTDYKTRQINFFYNLSMFIYYSMRTIFRFIELTGSNICIRREIFEEIKGFQQPPKLGVDMLFCNILRKHIHEKKRGKMKIIHTLYVETAVRHLETVRSLKRLGQHHTLSKDKPKKKI